MPRPIALAILVLSTTVARAELDPATATAQLRSRLRTEWQSVVDAPKWRGWYVEFRGRRITGDWMIELGGWRYFFAAGTVRCTEQGDEYMSCDDGDSVAPKWSAARRATPTLAQLVVLQRGVFGRGLGIVLDDERRGHAVIETVTSTPNAEQRTSRRYRAHATLIPETFAIGEPVLVEEYRETCIPVNGCYETHWSCMRAK